MLAQKGEVLDAKVQVAVVDPGTGYAGDERYDKRLAKHAKHVRKKAATLAKLVGALQGATGSVDQGWRRRLVSHIGHPVVPQRQQKAGKEVSSGIWVWAVSAVGFAAGAAAGFALLALRGSAHGPTGHGDGRDGNERAGRG
jgi:hypothetical protein